MTAPRRRAALAGALLVLGACASAARVSAEGALARAESRAEEARRAGASRQLETTYRFTLRQAREALEDGEYDAAARLAAEAETRALEATRATEVERRRVLERLAVVQDLVTRVREERWPFLDKDALFAAVSSEVAESRRRFEAGDLAAAGAAADRALAHLTRRRERYDRYGPYRLPAGADEGGAAGEPAADEEDRPGAFERVRRLFGGQGEGGDE